MCAAATAAITTATAAGTTATDTAPIRHLILAPGESDFGGEISP